MILLCLVMNLSTETNRFCLEEMLMLNPKSHLQKHTVRVWFEICEPPQLMSRFLVGFFFPGRVLFFLVGFPLLVTRFLSPAEPAGVVSKVGPALGLPCVPASTKQDSGPGQHKQVTEGRVWL